MSITLSALQKQRRDTAANWTTQNPTLLAGEIGLESDTGYWKVGDGTTAWATLAYVVGLGAEIPVSRLADGSARQLLQTAANGTDVEWASNIDVPGTLDVTGAATFDAAVTIQGDLTVNGTTTTIDTQNLIVEDKNIVVGQVTSPTDVTADGGGITLKGTTDKTINWIDSTDAWTFSEHVNIASGKEYRIAGTKVLDATSLGSAVVGSSLTSVGTIGTGVWQGTAVATGYGGTGQTSYTDGQLLIGNSIGNTLTKATLTAGSGISITNGSGSITIASTVSGGLPTTGGTLTGDLLMDNQSDVRFGEATANGSNWVAFQGASSIAANVTWTLPSADGTASQVLSTNGSGTLSWASPASGTVTSVTGTAPISVATGTTTPAISIASASTSVVGAVQLTDSTSSTSTTTAATPNSVKTAYDLANAALPKTGGALTGDITLNAQSDLRFADSDSSNWVAFQAPATVSTNVTWTLPNTDGTNGQALTTNGTGALSWQSSSAPVGSVIQVVQAFKSDTASGSSNAWTDVTGLSVSITPSSTANKILVMANVNMTSGGYFQGKIIRGTTDIAIGDAANLRTRSSFGGYNLSSFGGGFTFGVCKLDSPSSTSAQTYKIQMIATTSATWYINRGQNDSDEANQGRQVSSITVMEIKG